MTVRRPTLDDVARLAGVSGKTVARVVNNEASVSAATRERVNEAIARLGYRVNLSARSLASSRPYRIGVLSPWISAYFVTQIHMGAAAACRARGYQLTIQKLDRNQPDTLEDFARGLQDQPLEGVFLTAPLCDHAPLLDLLEQEGVRYVRHSPMQFPGRSDAVFAEETEGVTELIGHLWALGHRRFGLIKGPEGHLASKLRSEAALHAIADLGGDPGELASFEMPMRSSLFAQGFEAAAALLSQHPRPTAITAYNDEVAAGVLAYAHTAGLDLPADLAVSGYGDADFAILTWPQLTTVHQPNAEMAAAAVEWLTTAPAPEPRILRFPVKLVVRGSTQPSDPASLDMGERQQ